MILLSLLIRTQYAWQLLTLFLATQKNNHLTYPHPYIDEKIVRNAKKWQEVIKVMPEEYQQYFQKN